MSVKEDTILSTFTESRCSDYSYYNLLYVNDKPMLSPVLINDSRNSFIVGEGQRYRYTCSILRFLLDSFLMPATLLDYPEKYKITISVGIINYSVELAMAAVGNPNFYPLNVAIFTVEQWVDMLNVALEAAFQQAVAGGGFAGAFAPFFIYSGYNLTLVAEKSIYYPNNPLGAKIYVSNEIFTRLGGSCHYEYVVNNSPRDALIKVQPLGDNENPAGFYNTLGTPSIPTVSPTLNMAFTDSALVSLTTINQVLLQAISTEVRSQMYGSSAVNSANPSNNLTLQTLEDFIFVPNGRGKILFDPTNTRPFNLTSDMPISKFNFQVMYMNSDLAVYPLMAIPGSVSTFKFLFRKDFTENTSSVLLTIYNLLNKYAGKMITNK